MKFFLEFVSCCGSPTLRAPEPRAPTEDEERWLVPATAVTPGGSSSRRKKQRRKGAPDWRPSLGSISEDYIAPPRVRSNNPNDTVSSNGRDLKKRNNSAVPVTGAVKVHHHRSYSDSDGYYGSASMPTIMPTFSPTPFMF